MTPTTSGRLCFVQNGFGGRFEPVRHGPQTPRQIARDAPCKLHFGVPILRAEDPDFREFYDAGMKSVLSYEQKLKAMRFVPVTSIMTQDQFDRYAHEVQDHYRGRVALEFPKKDEQPKRRRAA